MQYGAIHEAHVFNPDLVQFIGFDSRFEPSIDFQPDALVLNLIPEPSAYALLAGLGVLGCAIWRRRR